VPVAGITASIALNKARVDKTASVFIAGGAGTWSPLPETPKAGTI
jgi:hypothetical protein